MSLFPQKWILLYHKRINIYYKLSFSVLNRCFIKEPTWGYSLVIWIMWNSWLLLKMNLNPLFKCEIERVPISWTRPVWRKRLNLNFKRTSVFYWIFSFEPLNESDWFLTKTGGWRFDGSALSPQTLQLWMKTSYQTAYQLFDAIKTFDQSLAQGSRAWDLLRWFYSLCF